MLTRTGEYALRAMVYLVRHEEDWPLVGKEIAGATKIPAKYLSKILGDLVRIGVLESTPGRHGGFRLLRSSKKTKLYDVLAPFEMLERKQCPFGNQECSDDKPCLAHDRWKKVVTTHKRFLSDTSIYDVSVPKPVRSRGAARKKKR